MFLIQAVRAIQLAAASQADPQTITEQIQKGGKDSVGFLKIVVWPALAALVPAAATAVFKIVQDHSRVRRSMQLTDRISALAKSLAELPELPPTNPGSVTPRAALATELNLVVSELNAIQTRERHGLRDVSANATARMRGALLLYRPKGLLAVSLHTLFFVYSVAALLLLIVTLSIVPHDTGDILAFMLLVTIATVPSLVLRHFAAKIHQKQCRVAQPAAPGNDLTPIGAPGALPQQQI